MLTADRLFENSVNSYRSETDTVIRRGKFLFENSVNSYRSETNGLSHVWINCLRIV